MQEKVLVDAHERCYSPREIDAGSQVKDIVEYLPGAREYMSASRFKKYIRPRMNAKHGAKWTAEEERILREKCELGLNVEEIAKLLPGRTARTYEARARLRHLLLLPKPVPPYYDRCYSLEGAAGRMAVAICSSSKHAVSYITVSPQHCILRR